jgi:phosphotransferase system  glucose/maltose/N-acetylglucosamine-specific IIC component
MVVIVVGACIFATFFSYFVVMIHHRNEATIVNDKKLA